MSGQHTPWWLKGEIIAYASSKDGMANRVISVAQFDNALPKNRTEYDVPLGRVDQSKELAAARARIAQLEAAIDKLAACKGRYHTEANFKELLAVREAK